MDLPHDISGSDRDDNRTRPTTPTGTEDLQHYSDIGLGTLASPPKVQRPVSAASRRSAVYSRKSSASPSSDRENDDVDQHNQAASPTIAFIPENAAQQTQVVGELNDCPKVTNVENNRAPMDAGEQAQHHNEKGKQEDRNKGHTETHYGNTLLEEEKLRIDNVTLEKELKALEAYCERQQREIDACREKQVSTERHAESRRQEAVEIKRSKDNLDTELAESQAQVRALEREIAKLRSLKDGKHKLNEAEWKLGDIYGELEQKKAEVSSLQSEVQQLRDSKELAEKARRKSEVERKKLHGHMKRTFLWIQEAHKQQAQRDMEQFRFHDAHFSSRGRQRTSTTHDSVRTSARQQEALGDFMSSRPESVTSQPLVSSARQSLASERAPLSRSQTSLSGATGLLVLGTPPGAPRAPATSQPTSMTSSSIPDNRLPTSKRVSFHPLPTPSGYRNASSRRQSDPSSRRSRNPSSLRNSLIPGRVCQSQPALAKYYQQLSITFEDFDASTSRTVAGRSLSMPITQKEHAEVREALHSTTPLRIIWDNSKHHAVFEPEPIATPVKFMPKPGSQGSLTVKTDTQENTLRHTPVIPGSANHLARASRDIVRHILATSEARTLSSPLGPPVSSSVYAVEDGTATSSATEYPPSPGLRKRQGGISAKTPSVRDPGLTQNASPSKIPLPCAVQDKAKDAHAAICTSSDSFDQLGCYKRMNGHRRWIPPVGRMAIVMATAISITMVICSLVLLASYTNTLPIKTPLFCTKARDHPASPVPVRTRLLCPTFSQDSASKAHQRQPEIFAKTNTVSAWLAETWISISTEKTESVTEIVIQTLRETQTQIHTETATKTQTVIEPSLHAQTEIQTETVTVFVALPSWLPPTRSFGSRIHSPGSEQNHSNQSAAEPVPGASPSLELDENRQWACFCPGTRSTPCGKPNATSLSSSQLPHPGRSIGPTASEIDGRAKKARQRNLHLQHGYTGPSYLGLLPPLQRMLEISQFKILELLLGDAWGAREY